MAVEQIDGHRDSTKNLKAGIIDFTAGSLGKNLLHVFLNFIYLIPIFSFFFLISYVLYLLEKR